MNNHVTIMMNKYKYNTCIINTGKTLLTICTDAIIIIRIIII